MKKLLSFLYISTCIIICTCKGPTGDVGPAGTGLTGTITGFIEIYDTDPSFKGSFKNDKRVFIKKYSGATVTGIGMGMTVTGITDTTGKFNLEGLKSGTYNITATKEGFGTDKIFSYQFIGGDVNNFTNKILKISRLDTNYFEIIGLEIELDTITKYNYDLWIWGDGKTYDSIFKIRTPRIYFLSKYKDVSFNNYSYYITPKEIINALVNNPSKEFASLFQISIWNTQFPFVKGDTIYIKGYAFNDFENKYYNPYLNKEIFEGINTNIFSTTKSIVYK
jgi:hypothetical protein